MNCGIFNFHQISNILQSSYKKEPPVYRNLNDLYSILDNHKLKVASELLLVSFVQKTTKSRRGTEGSPSGLCYVSTQNLHHSETHFDMQGQSFNPDVALKNIKQYIKHMRLFKAGT